MKAKRSKPVTRYLVIANPAAGKGGAIQKISEIQRELERLGLAFDLRLTEHTWHAAELAQQAVVLGYDVVVAAGGNGTVNEVLNGLLLAKEVGLGEACLGVLCTGQGNDFAYAMDVQSEIKAGCQALADNQRKMIDVGRVSGSFFPAGRYFGNGVGIGFEAVVNFYALQLKQLNGYKAYATAIIKAIQGYPRGPLVKIRYDEQELVQRCLLVSVMNGRRVGGGFMMAPTGVPDDGLFDVCVAGQVGRIKIGLMVPRFRKGTQGSDPSIKMLQARRVEISAVEGVLPAHVDGEVLATQADQITLELIPKAIQLIY
jgi:YegS/Rv2252/BmrU family lipid kinase